MWKIHGKCYDLTNFLDKHPGGKTILSACKGEEDVTAAFESNHAMCNMEKIHNIMKNYEIAGGGTGECEPSDFVFRPDGFYDKTKREVEEYFKQNGYSHHSNWGWAVKAVLQTAVWGLSFWGAFWSNKNDYYFVQLLSAILSGNVFIQWGFTVMHDASHSAISKDHRTNKVLANVWNGMALWDYKLWALHHVYRHHSFTGSKKDPGTVHFKPFVRKSFNEAKGNYLDNTLSERFILIVLCLLPGMWSGQVFSYLSWRFRGAIWRTGIKNNNTIRVPDVTSLLLNAFVIFSWIHSGNVAAICGYIFACNVSYMVGILPDHNTFETHKNTHHDYKAEDWGELQVRNSGNFSTENLWFTHLFGGINYQIEHHLFPTICHVHYPKISKIVQANCAEYNIPYVNHTSIFSAVRSTLTNLSYISKSED